MATRRPAKAVAPPVATTPKVPTHETKSTTSPAAKRSASDSATNVSMQSQKTFIIENSAILNRETKIAILSVVMMEVGPSAVMQRLGAKDVEINEVDIDLDICSKHKDGADIIQQIFNIVNGRLNILKQPAGSAVEAHPQKTAGGRAKTVATSAPAKATSPPAAKVAPAKVARPMPRAAPKV